MNFFENLFSIKNKIENYTKYKVITIFFIKIKFKIGMIQQMSNLPDQLPYWLSIGEHSYGFVLSNVEHYSADENIKLSIGDYCSIGPNVRFILASEHPYKVLSTYPFKVKMLGHEFEASSKGSIIVKDDVWIGLNSVILSGVTLGQGSVIAAGSIVTKDVPPYAIVAGNPAKIIKYRFEPEVIEKLVKFDFSKLTDEKVKYFGESLYTEITQENVDDIIAKFSGDFV